MGKLQLKTIVLHTIKILFSKKKYLTILITPYIRSNVHQNSERK